MTGELLIDQRNRAVRLGDHRWLSTVSLFADGHCQRQRGQQLHPVLVGQLHTTALTEQMLGMSAVGADVHGHVFHHAEHRNVHFAEHFHALARVEQGQVLWRGDDHRTGHRDFLRQGQLDVTGAWRHVDDQVIQIAPRGLCHQLQQGTGNHRPAPDHRRVVIGQERHGHHFDAMGLDRHEPLLILDLRPGAFSDAEHDALAWAVNVRIQNAHLGPFASQGQCQVGGGGGFAHAALAGGHGHHILDVGQARNLSLSLVRGNDAGDLDTRRRHAVQAFDSHLQQLRPATLEQTGGVAQLKLDVDAIARNIDAAHASGADRVLVQIRVGVLAKDGFHRCAIDGAHGQLR